MSEAISQATESRVPERRRWTAVLKLGIAAMFLFLTGGPAVIAQYDDSAASYWRQERQRMQRAQPAATKRPAARTVEQRPTRLIRGAAPKKGFTRVVPEVARSPGPEDPANQTPPTAAAPAQTGAAPGPAATTAVPAGTPATPSAQQVARPAPQSGAPMVRILVMGDNIAQQLARGLELAYAETPQIAVIRQARDSSGLVNTRFFDWAEAAKKLLSEGEKIDVAVMMLGSNDAQEIQDGRERHRVRSEGWTKIYKARIEAIAAQFREKKIPLIWVGMPIMRGERLAGEMLAFNELFREAVQRAGGTYVDVWEGFADDRNRFTLFGPDVNGQVVKLRTGDGVHFTPPGTRKLAYFLESPLKRFVDDRRPRTDPVIAALTPPAGPSTALPATQSQQVPAAQIAPKPALDSEASPAPPAVAALPPQPAVPQPLSAPERPAAGPVVRLTQPEIAADGELATSRRRKNAVPVLSALAQRRLVEGAPIEAQTGRADDFSWPRR